MSAILAMLAAFSLVAGPAVSADGTDPLKLAPVKRACASTAPVHQATCLALVRTDVAAHRGVQPLGSPAGLGAIDLQRAYNLPSSSAGKGQTVAIIDVYDDPNAEADLAVYRSQFGLPPCTTANGCFKKVNENGGTALPRPDSGWAEEESLDLDMVSAACPNCHILLVESSQPALTGLGEGVNAAIRLGAKYISNSYGGREDSSTPALDLYFDHPGVAITAASGDGGYGVLYPSTSRYVTAVGGTSLNRAANARGWNETAWSGAGSGCSALGAKPPWQKDTGCARRTVVDVSAVADPRTGVAVYDTYEEGGWLVVGGTSASAPIIAGAYALAGPPPPGDLTPAIPYAHADGLNDIVSGGNGTCIPAYLCTAGPGYDGPTGLGTPNGVSAFRGTNPALAGPAAPRRADRRPVRRAVAAPIVRPAGGAPIVRSAGGAPIPRPAGGAPIPRPAGGVPLANGGFESGDLTGWSPSGVLTGVTSDGPHGGRYAALLGDLDTPRKGDSSISQRFTAARTHRRLSFWYKVSCPDRVRYDWAQATLKDDTTGTDLMVLPKTCAYDDTWRQAVAPVVGGHSYTLTLLNHDDGYFGDPTATKYDDVTLS